MISVIIPTYNRADLLPKAIESVKSQTFKDIEIIVVDDGSTDNTERVVKELLGIRDTYIKLDTHTGSSAVPRNEGIKVAKGKYISLLDSDDWLDVTCLEKLYQKMVIANRNVGIIYAGRYLIDKNGLVKQKGHTFEKGYLFKESLEHCVCSTTGSLIKAECFNTCGLFDSSNIPPHEDMWIRISKEFEFDYVEEYLAYCLQHDKQYSKINSATTVKNMVEKHQNYYNAYPEILTWKYTVLTKLYRDSGNRYNYIKYFILSNHNRNLKYYITILLSVIHPKFPLLLSHIFSFIIDIIILIIALSMIVIGFWSCNLTGLP